METRDSWCCMPRYTALDAARLISDDGENFLCESCKGELVAESDKLAAQEVGDADDNMRRRRRETLREMLQKMEVCEFPISAHAVALHAMFYLIHFAGPCVWMFFLFLSDFIEDRIFLG